MTLTKNQILTFLAGMMIFLDIQPYFVWPLESFRYLKLGLKLFTLGLLWLNFEKLNQRNINLILFFLFTIVLMSVLNGLNIFGLFTNILLLTIPFVKLDFIKRTYYSFHKIYSFFILLSIIVLLLLIFGANIPYRVIPPLNSLKTYNYYAFPFLVMPEFSFVTLAEIGRFFGLFDEPGVIGTIGLIILYIENFNLKKWQNIIIFLSGVLSFSLFFYIASFLYFIFYIFNNDIKFVYRILIIAAVTIFVVLSFENDFFTSYIWERVEWDAERLTIKGDNRAHDDLRIYFDKIRGTEKYFWGIGLTDAELLSSFDDSAGYRNAILRYGFIGFLLYVLFFIIFAYKQIGRKKELMLFILLFGMTIFQRPSLLSIHYLFLFVSFIFLNSSNEQIKKQQIK